MHVLLIGNASGRLSCLAQALKKGNQCILDIYTNTSNPSLNAFGMVNIGEPNDPNYITDWIKRYDQISRSGETIAVISDEAALAAGMTDRLLDLNIGVVGPTMALTIEASKSRTRELLDKHDIPGNPVWRVFDGTGHSLPELLEHIAVWMESLGDDVVIKPDGLTGGKGVWVKDDHFVTQSQGLEYCRQIIAGGSKVVVEEKLYGEEFSLQSISDGTTVQDFFPVQDYKRLRIGDAGPNTGGMGSVGAAHELLWFLTPDLLRQASEINRRVLAVLQRDTGVQYRGILYGNYIVTKNGLRLIEINCRFGDPEVMNALPLLETPFCELAHNIANGSLSDSLQFKPAYSVVKYLVPNGYPDNPLPGIEIQIGAIGVQQNLRIFCGSMIRKGDDKTTTWHTTGSRTLAVLGVGDVLAEAEEIAETAASQAPGCFYHRRDIGTEELFAMRKARFDTIIKG